VKRARAAVLAVGLLGLLVVLTPIWFIHHLLTRVTTARRGSGRIDIQRTPAGSITIDQAIEAGRPVIIEGLLGALGIDDVATPDDIERAAGDQTITETSYDDGSPYFLYSGGYDTDVVGKQQMKVSDFLSMMFDSGVDSGTVVYQLFGNRSLDGEGAVILDRIDAAVRQHSAAPTEPRFSGVWIGSPGATTPLHHDAWPGLLMQTHGTKRVALYEPVDRTNLSFRLPLRGQGRWSDLPGRSDNASTTDFPRLSHTQRFVGELHPGEALYIPPFWAHEMEAVEANISVPFRFAGPRSSYFNPGFLRPASEMLRQQLDTIAAG